MGLRDNVKQPRATSAFIGDCPTVEICIAGVRLTGLLDTGSQVTLMQQSLLKQHFAGHQVRVGTSPSVLTLKAANGLEIPYIGYAMMDFEIEGLKIPDRGVVIVKDECSSNPLIVGMNVIRACWEQLFRNPERPEPLVCQDPRSQHTWSSAFASYQRIVATREDGFLGYVRPAARRKVCVPARSEIVVRGRAPTGLHGQTYHGFLQALPEPGAVGVARTLAVVKNGRLPVHVRNLNPSSLFIRPYQKLGEIFEVEETDVRGARDLSLTMDDNGVVEVGLVEAGPVQGAGESQFEVSELLNRPDLTDEQQNALTALLHKWEVVFAKNDEDFGRTDIVQHRIPTGDSASIRERFRPLPPMMYQAMRALLYSMLEGGVISESSSPWAAPIVIVKKKDGSWRFCVDSVTHKDAFPLPRIEETLTSLTKAEWFTTLDLASGYWQVEVHPQDRKNCIYHASRSL